MPVYYVAWTERIMYTRRVEAADFEAATEAAIEQGDGEEVFCDSDGVIKSTIEDLSYMYEERG